MLLCLAENDLERCKSVNLKSLTVPSVFHLLTCVREEGLLKVTFKVVCKMHSHSILA